MKYTNAEYVGSYPDYKMAPRSGAPEISFGGRSNVGKSSLINCLVKRRNLAQTSKTPGKTKLLNFFSLSDGKKKEQLFLVDLPGFGYARVSAETRRGWQGFVEAYIEGSEQLRGFILLIDSRRGLQEEEIQLVEYLIAHGKNTCPVLTKSDKLNRSQGSQIVRETTAILGPYGELVHMPILHSAVSGNGNDLIWRWIIERIDNET